MSNNQHAKDQSRNSFPSSHDDSPWGNPNIAPCHNAKRETPVQCEIPDMETTLSGTSLETSFDQQTRWEQTHRYESNGFQGLCCPNDNGIDVPYSLALSSDTTPTSHSSPEELMEPLGTIESSAPESPDAWASDRDKNPSSRSVMVGRPRPFSRKSKAGNPHTVTPSAAGPEGGFICKFPKGDGFCREKFKLPSDIRFHLIEDHIGFSPFQCENCMRIYTRKSLYTRHLKENTLEGSTRRPRQCPHRAADPDNAFRARKNTCEALWAIQLTQDQVDHAVDIIKKYNGELPSRRRRTQNPNFSDRTTSGLDLEPQLAQSADHSFQQRDERDYATQQDSPPLGSDAVGATFPSALMRSLSAPDLVLQTRNTAGYPTQSAMTSPTEVHRRSPVPAFGSNLAFHNVSTYPTEQDSSSLPTTYHRYLEAYDQTPRPPKFYEQPQGYLETVPVVDRHILHQTPVHRHNSWDGSSGGMNDGSHGAWTPAARDQNYHHQLSYRNESQEYK